MGLKATRLSLVQPFFYNEKPSSIHPHMLVLDHSCHSTTSGLFETTTAILSETRSPAKALDFPLSSRAGLSMKLSWMDMSVLQLESRAAALRTVIRSEKRDVGAISSLCEHPRAHLHIPRWSSPPHTWAARYSPPLPGHQPAWHVTAQNNTR